MRVDLAQRLLACAMTAYPSRYRSEYGAEMLNVLSESGRAARWPTMLVEVGSLAYNGLLVRWRGSHTSPAWENAGPAAAIGVAILLFGVAVDAGAHLLVDLYWTLAGSPGSVWVDPMWAAFVCWIAVCGALVFGRVTLARLASVGAVVGSVAALAVSYWEARERGGDGVWALDGAAYVGASVALAVLLGRSSRARLSHKLVNQSRVPSVVATIWVGHVVLSVVVRNPVSPVWAAGLTAGFLLAAFLHWGTLLRGVILIGVAFAAIPVLRASDLLGRVVSEETAQVLALALVLASCCAMGWAAVHIADRRFQYHAVIRASAASLVARRAHVPASTGAEA